MRPLSLLAFSFVLVSAAPSFGQVVRISPDGKVPELPAPNPSENGRGSPSETSEREKEEAKGEEASSDSTASPSAENSGDEGATNSKGSGDATTDEKRESKKKKSKRRDLDAEESEDLTKPRVLAAPPAAPEPAVDPETRPFSHHTNRWEIALGGSMLWTSSAGLAYFSEKNLLGRFSARAARSFSLGERLSFAVSPEWNVIGSADDGARGNRSFLRMSEFSLGLELRYLLSTRFGGYVRFSPGGTHTQAELSNGEALLAHESFYFHGDLSLGATSLLIGARRGDEAGLRLHAYLEAGYDWMPSRTLTLSPKSAPERAESFDISDLSLSAPHLGTGLVLSY